MASIQADTLGYLHRHGRGMACTSKDLVYLGSRAAVDQALSRLYDPLDRGHHSQDRPQ